MSGPALELIRRAQEGDSAADEQLLTENNGLIWSIARRYFGRGVEPDDLYQMASLGFLKAVRGFDDQYGTQFSTYAVPKIAGEIRRFLRDDGPVKVSRTLKDQARQLWQIQHEMETEFGREITISELADRAGVSVEEAAMAAQAACPVESLEQPAGEEGMTLLDRLSGDSMEESLALRLSLHDAIAALPERLGQVISLRYGRELTQQQTARILGVSQVQISRLERKAIEELRRALVT